MKILLDECVTKRLKRYLDGFEVFTVVEMGWSGIKNGKLMTLCVENNFDILLTIDKNLVFQQNVDRFPLTIVVLDCPSSKVEDLIIFLPQLRQRVENFEKFKAHLIQK